MSKNKAKPESKPQPHSKRDELLDRLKAIQDRHRDEKRMIQRMANVIAMQEIEKMLWALDRTHQKKDIMA